MASVFINEFHYDNTGGDIGEFIEIAGPAGTDLTGWSIVRYNGSNGEVYTTPTPNSSLSGTIPDQGNGFGTVSVSYPPNGLQNGAPDGFALVDDTGAVVQFLSYEGTFIAVGGPADGQETTDVGVAESSSTPVGSSLQLTGEGSESEDFTWAAPADGTPGAVNTDQTFESQQMATFTINEVDADTPGSDTAEFVELYDGGVGNTSLDGLSVVFFNGSDDASYEAFDLDGLSTNADGFFVLGNPGVANVDLTFEPGGSGALQNGADAVALYEADATDFPNDTPVTTTNLLDAVVYDTNDGDDAGLLTGLGQTTQFNENANSNGVTESNSRVPDGTGEFVAQAPTPGTANSVTTGTTLAIAPDNAVQAEGDADTTPFTFTVTRTVDTSGTTSVDFAVSGDVDAADFGGTLPTGTVEFANGEATQTITLDVSGDTDAEPDEAFTVTLSDATGGATISTASADGTIQNDDAVVITPISEIQGEGHVSEFVLADGQSTIDFFDTLPASTFSIEGDAVTTTGIVTAVDSNGFYLQDPTGDGNDNTSDALFVFTSSAPTVVVGDAVQVSGTVAEFFPGRTSSRNLPTTQIVDPTITVDSTGNPLPAAQIIGTSGRIPPSENIDDDAFATYEPATDGIDFFESLEGMLVTAEDVVAVGPTNRFGEIFGVVNGGADATGISDRGTLNISETDFNPEKVQIDEDSGIFNFDFPDVDAGAQLGNVTGVVSYSFGNFEILPTEDFTTNVVDSTLSAETTEIAGSEDKLTIASYNVLNLDPNDGDGDTDVADGRFDAIAQQIVTNLNAPDIIGLQEIQDNNGSSGGGVTAADETLQALVDAIAAAGGPTYTFIDNTFIGNNTSGGQPEGNIRTAFLYNDERVDLQQGSVQTIDGQGSGEAFEGARLPLVATFEFNDEDITVVNNHFSSKGGSAPILGIEQDFADRQEDVEVNGSLDERQAQSNAVQDFVSGLSSDTNVVVLGDLNEFEFVSPVSELETDAGLNNLINTIEDDERYSFIFQGNSQVIDHILVSDGLVEGAEIDIVHVNTEFAATESRASDHDPVVASLNIEANNNGGGGNGVPFIKGQRATIFVNGDNIVVGDAEQEGQTYAGELFSETDSTNNPTDVIAGTSRRDNIWGGTLGDDIISSGNGADTIGIGMGDVCVLAGAGADFVYGIQGGGGNNDIDLGAGADSFFARAGNNTIVGTGNNTIGIGTGNDTVTTQGGNDFVYSVSGGGGTNTLDLGGGDNLVWVQAGDYSITTGNGDDEIGLGTGTDTVDAGNGNNIIYMAATGNNDGNKDIITGRGDDYIALGSGDDLVDAGRGTNTLLGRGGADTFTVRTGAFNALPDFEVGTDLIKLDGLSFSDLSFFQGQGDRSDLVFGFAGGEGIFEVRNVTVAEINNQANFV